MSPELHAVPADPAVATAVVADYARALRTCNTASESGILLGLLRMCVDGDAFTQKIATATARAVVAEYERHRAAVLGDPAA